MSFPFARRMALAHRSFIREILKVTADPTIISFAGGLPHPDLFPTEEVAEAAAVEIAQFGRSALQYSTTEGNAELRAYIARRYTEKTGLPVDADDILITTGSQQGLDLLAKVFLDPGDKVVIERPGYLGAIQAMSLFEPNWAPVELEDDGPVPGQLEAALRGAKLFYAVPNFQNPSGVTWSSAKRDAAAQLVRESGALFMEDDPYGELRFLGQEQATVFGRLGGQAVLLGTFSKVAAPGFRIGWLVAPQEIRERLVVAKQAADLHTSTLAQNILMRFLASNDLDAHIARIRERYGRQRQAMVEAMARHFPADVGFTHPEGGMFLWVRLPEGCSAMELFDLAIAEKVAFVPGRPFYVDGGGDRALRLNFSNSSEDRIEEGMKRLGRCLETLLSRRTRPAE